jgi:imidazolonepropionase-like amidohydrolase
MRAETYRERFMILFENTRIFDGSGAPPFPGEVLVEENRIAAVARAGQASLSRANVTVVDAGGATLMPGLTEAHAHLSWPSSVERFVPGMELPPEDLLLNTARNARILLDHGFTSAYSAGALGKTLEMSLKAQIDSGGMPGPRLIPSSIEREPPNESVYLASGKVAEHGKGPEAILGFIKECAASGAKVVKFLLSGESALKPGASQQLLYSEEEIRAAGIQARESNVWLTGHAHAAEAIKMGVRHGFRVLYHCTYADEEAIDMLAERKADIFVGPTLGIVQATLDAKPPPHIDMSHMKNDAATVLEHQRKLGPILKARGVRLLPGGDYGFPFNPNGRNACDLDLFVRHLGFTPTEALVAATRLGGEIMGMGEELGQIRAGFLADLLLVEGDPTQDIALLQNRENLRAIMKDGKFHKPPAPRH